MSLSNNWIAVENSAELIKVLQFKNPLKEITLLEKRIVLSFHDGQFGAINAQCNHMRGPLAKGRLKSGYIECPWHYWSFHHQSGKALDKSFEPLASCGGAVSNFPIKIENETIFIDLSSETERVKPNFNPALAVAREPVRAEGRIRVVGISTTIFDPHHPRYSTSEDLLRSALQKASGELDVETQVISLSELNFKNCEGFYSKSEKACTWPCSVTKMDPADEMVKIYEALVHWADVVVIASPIRWGSASSLYYKMVERLNSVQNQITLRNRVLIKNKVASFIITGGQDNIQSIAGQMLMFFGELGFVSPPFPFVAHSLGWSAEEMEKNEDFVAASETLHNQSFELIQRSVELYKKISV